jgi:hypothetical protein
MMLTRVVYSTDDDQSEAFMVKQARIALSSIDAMEDDTEGNSDESLNRSSDKEIHLEFPASAAKSLMNGSIRRTSPQLTELLPENSGDKAPTSVIVEKKKCCNCCSIL